MTRDFVKIVDDLRSAARENDAVYGLLCFLYQSGFDSESNSDDSGYPAAVGIAAQLSFGDRDLKDSNER